jgi:hypothetical protein
MPQPASGQGRDSTRRDVHRDFEAEPDIFELGLGPQHDLPQGWSSDDRYRNGYYISCRWRRKPCAAMLLRDRAAGGLAPSHRLNRNDLFYQR